MYVSEIMTLGAHTCGARDSLNDAARTMWEHDLGALPVVDGEGHVIAMVTDRDICMAAYTQGLPLMRIPVSAACSRTVFTVYEDDTLSLAEGLMRQHQIRRVPVVDRAHKPVGMLSMNDLARHASKPGQRHNGLSPSTIVETLAAVCEPTADLPQIVAAAF